MRISDWSSDVFSSDLTATIVATSRKDSEPPNVCAEKKTDVGVARRSRTNKSPISDTATGLSTASPTPTPMRKANSHSKLGTNEEAAVENDHSETPATAIHFRFPQSRPQAMGIADSV